MIEDRLEVLAKNNDLIKMPLSASLRDHFTNEVNLPENIYSSLKQGLQNHFNPKGQTVDINFCARQLGGIFLSYLILQKSQQYNELTVRKKESSKKTCKIRSCYNLMLLGSAGI